MIRNYSVVDSKFRLSAALQSSGNTFETMRKLKTEGIKIQKVTDNKI